MRTNFLVSALALWTVADGMKLHTSLTDERQFIYKVSFHFREDVAGAPDDVKNICGPAGATFGVKLLRDVDPSICESGKLWTMTVSHPGGKAQHAATLTCVESFDGDNEPLLGSQQIACRNALECNSNECADPERWNMRRNSDCDWDDGSPNSGFQSTWITSPNNFVPADVAIRDCAIRCDLEPGCSSFRAAQWGNQQSTWNCEMSNTLTHFYSSGDFVSGGYTCGTRLTNGFLARSASPTPLESAPDCNSQKTEDKCKAASDQGAGCEWTKEDRSASEMAPTIMANPKCMPKTTLATRKLPAAKTTAEAIKRYENRALQSNLKKGEDGEEYEVTALDKSCELEGAAGEALNDLPEMLANPDNKAQTDRTIGKTVVSGPVQKSLYCATVGLIKTAAANGGTFGPSDPGKAAAYLMKGDSQQFMKLVKKGNDHLKKAAELLFGYSKTMSLRENLKDSDLEKFNTVLNAAKELGVQVRDLPVNNLDEVTQKDFPTAYPEPQAALEEAKADEDVQTWRAGLQKQRKERAR